MKIKWFGYVLLIMLAIGVSASFISTSYAQVSIESITPAGTVIENVATVNYKDDNLNPLPPITSEPATTIVSQVYGVDVSPETGAETVLAGDTAHYPVTVTNTGNGDDTFDLTATSSNGYLTNIYFDANGDGVLDQAEIDAGPITSTAQLPAEGTYNLIVTVDIPPEAADGTTDTLTLTATSQGDGAVTDTGTYITTVSKAVLTMSKTQDISNPKPGDIITYTITYTNAGTATALNAVAVTDPIPSDVTYVAESITLNGTPQTDAPGDDSAEFSANTVTANVGNVAPAGTGTIVFKVQVNAGVPAGTHIFNTATANYEDELGNPQTPVDATTPPATVAQVAGVDISPPTQTQVADPGDEVVYPFTVTNTGNGDDVFNGEITSTAGLTWEFYVDANGDGILNAGDYLATDSDSDGIPDTGVLAPGETKNYLAVATVPPGEADGTVDVTTITAISAFDPTVQDSATLTTTVTAPLITVSKTVSPTGDQPPGTELTYTITVTNTGTGNAQEVVVTDSLPTDTTYVAESVTLNGVPKTDAVDGDQVSVAAGTVTANAGLLGPGGTATITLKATID